MQSHKSLWSLALASLIALMMFVGRPVVTGLTASHPVIVRTTTHSTMLSDESDPPISSATLTVQST